MEQSKIQYCFWIGFHIINSVMELRRFSFIIIVSEKSYLKLIKSIRHLKPKRFIVANFPESGIIL